MRNLITLTIVTLGLCFPVSGLLAQQNGSSHPSASHPTEGEGTHGTYSSAVPIRHADDNDAHRQMNGYFENLKASRETLAKGWQSMGMSKAQAEAVAKYYDPAATDMTRHRTANDSDPQKAAASIQAALNAKNYRLANQLLIRYMKSKSGMPDERRDS